MNRGLALVETSFGDDFQRQIGLTKPRITLAARGAGGALLGQHLLHLLRREGRARRHKPRTRPTTRGFLEKLPIEILRACTRGHGLWPCPGQFADSDYCKRQTFLERFVDDRAHGYAGLPTTCVELVHDPV